MNKEAIKEAKNLLVEFIKTNEGLCVTLMDNVRKAIDLLPEKPRTYQCPKCKRFYGCKTICNYCKDTQTILPYEEKPPCSECGGSEKVTPFDITKPIIPCPACKPDDAGELQIHKAMVSMDTNHKKHAAYLKEQIAQLQQENAEVTKNFNDGVEVTQRQAEQIAELQVVIEERECQSCIDIKNGLQAKQEAEDGR